MSLIFGAVAEADSFRQSGKGKARTRRGRKRWLREELRSVRRGLLIQKWDTLGSKGVIASSPAALWQRQNSKRRRRTWLPAISRLSIHEALRRSCPTCNYRCIVCIMPTCFTHQGQEAHYPRSCEERSTKIRVSLVPRPRAWSSIDYARLVPRNIALYSLFKLY